MRLRILTFLFASITTFAADLKTTNSGVEVAVGSLGSFMLSYPEFEPAHKIIEVKVMGIRRT